MKIYSRRYTGSKYKLTEWIKEKLQAECNDARSFFDVFAGTGVVTAACLNDYDEFYINDFLYSNEVIYRGFFEKENYCTTKLESFETDYNSLNPDVIGDNYVSDNFGNKYFSHNDAKIIGFIRQDIEDKYIEKIINKKEHDILLASLLYSFDRIANTVGHYEAFIKGKLISDQFVFELIEPYETNKPIHIFREDSNALCKRISCDIAFVDPPYSSRQYSRFYHVLETITKWEKPELQGVAMKPPVENMSDYCINQAPKAFKDLVENLHAKYIAVTYNNTYDSKSSSSKNKISLEEIESILKKRGEVVVFDHYHNAFNAGKTELDGHKEYLFICKTKQSNKEMPMRSPLFYVGDKYKLMPQLNKLFPNTINNYVEPFVGGGSSFLNTKANHYYLNDLDPWVIELHKELNKYRENKDALLRSLYLIIDDYGLTCSFKGKDVPEGFRELYKKTYFAKANKNAYVQLRNDFNDSKGDIKKLYILLIYGFNHMIRFNSKGEFNLPVGNVDFNKNVYTALTNYLDACSSKDLHFYNMDYKDFIETVNLDEESFVYFDPPYLIASSEYNKMWDEEEENNLYKIIDNLDEKGIKFGLTNLVHHKGSTNEMLLDWYGKYNVYKIESNYISFNDNTIKDDSQEVFITNYGQK